MATGVLFCMRDRVEFVPEAREPEAYAGFLCDDLRIYVSRDTKLSDQAWDVLHGYERKRLIESDDMKLDDEPPIDMVALQRLRKASP